MQTDIRIHSSLQSVSRNAHDTVPRHFGPPGAVDYRTLPGRTPRSDDPNLIFQGMCDREPKNMCPDVKVLKGTAYSYKNRQIISRWVRDVCAAFKLRTSTFNLGLQLCDVFMLRNLQSIQVSKCQCVALASIWLAAKFEELDHMVPPAQHLSDVCDRAYPPAEIIEMEERILATLRWKLPHTTTTNFLYFFLHVLTHNAGFDSAPIGQKMTTTQQNRSKDSNNNNNSRTSSSNNSTNARMNDAFVIRRVLLLKPGTQGSSPTTGVPSAGPAKPEVADEWVDVTAIVSSARDLVSNATSSSNSSSSSSFPQIVDAAIATMIQKLCIAMGHTPTNFIRDSTTGQTRVAHTTILQLQGKSLVLAYKIRPASLLGIFVPGTGRNNLGSGNGNANVNGNGGGDAATAAADDDDNDDDDTIDVIVPSGMTTTTATTATTATTTTVVGAENGEVRLFLRIDKQDGTFSECRGVSLLRGPNNELLRTADALTREAFLHVEFLPCQAHEMALAILTVSLIATSSDTAEVSLLLGMLLRRLKIDATIKSNFVMAAQLLCEKALAGGVIGGHPDQEGSCAAGENTVEGERIKKIYLDRNKAVLNSLCALTNNNNNNNHNNINNSNDGGGGSSRPKLQSNGSVTANVDL